MAAPGGRPCFAVAGSRVGSVPCHRRPANVPRVQPYRVLRHFPREAKAVWHPVPSPLGGWGTSWSPRKRVSPGSHVMLNSFPGCRLGVHRGSRVHTRSVSPCEQAHTSPSWLSAGRWGQDGPSLGLARRDVSTGRTPVCCHPFPPSSWPVCWVVLKAPTCHRAWERGQYLGTMGHGTLDTSLAAASARWGHREWWWGARRPGGRQSSALAPGGFQGRGRSRWAGTLGVSCHRGPCSSAMAGVCGSGTTASWPAAPLLPGGVLCTAPCPSLDPQGWWRGRDTRLQVLLAVPVLRAQLGRVTGGFGRLSVVYK